MADILVVDDDPVAQRVLRAQLRTAGHVAVAARSGELGLKELAEHPCELVILDIGLPDMDGLSLLRILRADPTHAAIPIIILTASGQANDSTEAEESGANVFLQKPASTNELVETVGRLLNRK